MARQDGKSVTIRDDLITIGDEEFKIADLDRIPEKYRANLDRPSRPSHDAGASANPDITLDRPPRPTPDAGASANPDVRATRLPPSTHSKPVKIKMTRAGLTFSGPSAYLSHMHRCQFVFKGNPYSSVEQGYHHQHAEFEKEFEIAKKIMLIHNAYDIKDAAASLPKSEAWGKIAPSVMWKLNEAKFDQNPDLKKQLLDTAPTPLIEASIDSKWGGACPFGSDIYEQGQVPGSNLCGTQLTKYRDDLLATMAEYSMT